MTQSMTHEQQWGTLSELYAFLGNSLLKPMTQTARVGLDPEFWACVPDFNSEEVRDAVAACADFARKASAGDIDEAVKQVSVEYTHLFIGPPSPAAAPWETMYRGSNKTVGFGEATHAMREELRQLGLELNNENNQYEDHMGIELLCLSEMCKRVAQGEYAAQDAQAFATRRPASWIAALYERVSADTPNSYLAHILNLTKALLLR